MIAALVIAEELKHLCLANQFGNRMEWVSWSLVTGTCIWSITRVCWSKRRNLLVVL